MKYRAQSIFRQAEIYERAARLLNASDFDMLAPSMVNAALSLELYFKSLYILDRGCDFKVNGRHSHDFAVLFESLLEETKMQLLAKFNAALSTRNNADIDRFKSVANVVVPKDLKTNLAEWASIFVDLRYAYDFSEKYKGKQKTMMFFPEIRDAVHRTIIDHQHWQA